MGQLAPSRNVDLIVYTFSRQHDQVFQNIGFHHVAIHRYNETSDPNYWDLQRQKGAIKAMVTPWLPDTSAPEADWTLASTSWFDDYDWVITVNADVMIHS
jgi:hypothetical protein